MIMLLMSTRIFYKIMALVLLIILYGDALGTTRDNFIDMCKEYYQQYNIYWMVDNSISPKCSICEQYDIAHYAFDVKKMVALKIF